MCPQGWGIFLCAVLHTALIQLIEFSEFPYANREM